VIDSLDKKLKGKFPKRHITVLTLAVHMHEAIDRKIEEEGKKDRYKKTKKIDNK